MDYVRRFIQDRVLQEDPMRQAIFEHMAHVKASHEESFSHTEFMSSLKSETSSSKMRRQFWKYTEESAIGGGVGQQKNAGSAKFEGKTSPGLAFDEKNPVSENLDM